MGQEEGGTEAAMYWMPDALLPGPCLDVYRKGSVDIIGMLVDIYGSTDLFLNEYRMLLSDKLLALTSYHIDHEVSAPPHPIPFPPSYQLPPLPHPSSVPTSPPRLHPPSEGPPPLPSTGPITAAAVAQGRAGGPPPGPSAGSQAIGNPHEGTIGNIQLIQ